MFLERPLAMFLGITVVPLRSLYHSLQFAAVALLFGIALAIGIPVILGLVFYKYNLSMSLNLLLTTLVVFPITALLISFCLAAVAVYLVYATVIDLVTSTWLGLKSGFVDGMVGFWRTLGTQTSYFDGFSIRLRAMLNRVSVEDQINNIEDFNAFELVDVVVPPRNLIVPNLQDSTPRVQANMLLSTEVKSASNLVNDFAHLTSPLSKDIQKQIKQLEDIKNQIELLKVRSKQYEDLSTRLASIKDALAKGDLSKIEDQVIAHNDITIPILLVKQYEESGSWHSVPANGYVTDKESILTWLKTNPKHPLNREILNNPPKYKEMPTRYMWHVLTDQNCYAQELDEGAAEIRDLLKKLPVQLDSLKKEVESFIKESLKKNKVNQGTFSQAFFGTSRLSNKAQQEIDPDASCSADATF